MADIAKTKYTEQYIQNMSFDDGLKVSVTELIGADGVLKNPATEETLKKIAEENYDNIVVDTSGGSTIVVYKKLGSTVVDTKTITII
jgi:hypothetical protein